jgi:hypothetical protein
MRRGRDVRTLKIVFVIVQILQYVSVRVGIWVATLLHVHLWTITGKK